MEEVTRWRDAVTEVFELLLQYNEIEDNVWLRNFPSGSCSVTSYAIGRLLLERYGEQWLLTSRTGEGGSGFRSHTWLVRDPAAGPAASIDATVYQFEDIANEPFVGFSESPAAASFPANGSDIYVALATGGWHHRFTDGIYEWLFPRLGLSPFERGSDLRHLLPEDVAYPPVARLVDAMLDASETTAPMSSYAVALSYRSKRTLERNSDQALRRYAGATGAYRGRPMVDIEGMDDDTVFMVTESGDDQDRLFLLGSIRSQRFQVLSTAELATFDSASLT